MSPFDLMEPSGEGERLAGVRLTLTQQIAECRHGPRVIDHSDIASGAERIREPRRRRHQVDPRHRPTEHDDRRPTHPGPRWGRRGREQSGEMSANPDGEGRLPQQERIKARAPDSPQLRVADRGHSCRAALPGEEREFTNQIPTGEFAHEDGTVRTLTLDAESTTQDDEAIVALGTLSKEHVAALEQFRFDALRHAIDYVGGRSGEDTTAA